jgi:hypothetical protein
MNNRILYIAWILALLVFSNSCQEDEYIVPKAKIHFQNDCIKRTLGPNIVGLDIEFAYAMALGFEKGKIISAQVEATIPGAAGTYMEHRSFYTTMAGADVGIEVGNPSVTIGSKTEVVFKKDTCAATLRYYYKIPEEARGKLVSFIFSAKASTGETVFYNMGPYNIAKMEMKRDIVLSDNNLCYFSIEDMQVYNSTDAMAKAGKIDLVYLYRQISGINFNHALVSPATNSEFLPGINLPTGVNRTAKIFKTLYLRDQHLARLSYAVFIDDLDFELLDISDAPDYAINLIAEMGIWIETADKKYRAYIFVNSTNNVAMTMTVSIKRYKL